MIPTSRKAGEPSPRLLILAASADLYGSDRTLLHAIPELVEAFDVTVALPAEGDLAGEVEAQGARVLKLPDYALRRRHLKARALPRWSWHCVAALVSLHGVRRRQGFDLIYSNTLAAGIGPILQLAWRIPHVLHVHECPEEPPWFPRVALWIARRSCHRVICNSEHVRRFVTRHEPRLSDRAMVIHNGSEVPTATSPAAKSDAFRICCVGRIHRNKGQHVLIEAVHLAERRRRWELHFFGEPLEGDEVLRNELEALAKTYGLGEQVHWHGFVKSTNALYQDADVCVVPSLIPEGFSLVCLEAQAMGVPVVATGPGGTCEVLAEGRTGYILPAGDAPALADALEKLADDEMLREALGQAGRERARLLYSRERYGRSIRAVCIEALAATPAGVVEEAH